METLLENVNKIVLKEARQQFIRNLDEKFYFFWSSIPVITNSYDWAKGNVWRLCTCLERILITIIWKKVFPGSIFVTRYPFVIPVEQVPHRNINVFRQ